MNNIKSLIIVCVTLVLLGVCITLKPTIDQRFSSTQRVALETAIFNEREQNQMLTQQISTLNNRIRELESLKNNLQNVAREEVEKVKKQSTVDNTNRRDNNYLLYRAELMETWQIRFHDLVKNRASQASINLELLKLKAQLRSKYHIVNDPDDRIILNMNERLNFR